MTSGDLTTLANAKAWCGNPSGASDAMIVRLITQATRFICNYTSRPFFLPAAVSEVQDGMGSDTMEISGGPGARRIALRRFPVLSLTSLKIDGELIEEAPALVAGVLDQPGWVLDPWDGTIPGNFQALTLRGFQRFRYGMRNIEVAYVAGFQTTGEAQSIPAGTPFTLTALQQLGRWGSDRGITFANGTALVPVASAPATGQYTIDNAGGYTFATADAGKAVLLTYGFIPSDIEQACIELVSERFKYSERIGIASKSLGGQETVSFTLKTMPSYVSDLLAAYRDPTIA